MYKRIVVETPSDIYDIYLTHRISDSWGSFWCLFIENHRGFWSRKVSIPPWAERSSEICVPLRMAGIAQFHDDSSRQNVAVGWLSLFGGDVDRKKCGLSHAHSAEDLRIDVWSCLVLLLLEILDLATPDLSGPSSMILISGPFEISSDPLGQEPTVFWVNIPNCDEGIKVSLATKKRCNVVKWHAGPPWMYEAGK